MKKSNSLVKAKNEFKIIKLLAQLRLREYSDSMGDVLTRYKLFVLFLAGILFTSLKQILGIIIWPFDNIIKPHTSYLNVANSLSLYQLLGVLWIMINYKALFKFSFNRYFASLPVNKSLKILNEFISLSIINLLIWLLLFCSLVSEYMVCKSMPQFVLISLKFLLNISLLNLVQLSIIKRNCLSLISVFLIDLCQMFSGIFLKKVYFIFLLLIFVTFWAFLLTFKSTKTLNRRIENFVNYIPIIKLSPILYIQAKNLILNSGKQLIGIGITLLLSLITLLNFVIYGKENPNLNFIISILILFNSYSISNIFHCLKQERSNLNFLLYSLPLTSFIFFKYDFILASISNLIINIFVLAFAVYFISINFIFNFFIQLFVSFCFLATAYWFQITIPKYGPIFTLLPLAIFVYVNYLIIYK